MYMYNSIYPVPKSCPLSWVMSDGPSSLLVGWDELSLDQARGPVIQYNVLYRKRRQNFFRVSFIADTGTRQHVITGILSTTGHLISYLVWYW